jgi:hypothetical protein
MYIQVRKRKLYAEASQLHGSEVFFFFLQFFIIELYIFMTKKYTIIEPGKNIIGKYACGWAGGRAAL